LLAIALTQKEEAKLSNNFSPFGFRPVSTSNGPMNWRISTRRIAAGNTTAIYKGDAVVPVTGTPNGYITQATTGGAVPRAGVFWGCQYLSTSQKRTVWSQYWPGSDATGDVIAYVIDDPNARFIVQTSGAAFQITGTLTNFGSSPVGKLAQLNVGAGNANTQQSGMFLDTVGTTNTFPFQIVDMVIDPPGSNGSDATSNYNYVVVGFNNEMLRSNGAVTGI
jgi:hypothetical protein